MRNNLDVDGIIGEEITEDDEVEADEDMSPNVINDVQGKNNKKIVNPTKRELANIIKLYEDIKNMKPNTISLVKYNSYLGLAKLQKGNVDNNKELEEKNEDLQKIREFYMQNPTI